MGRGQAGQLTAYPPVGMEERLKPSQLAACSRAFRWRHWLTMFAKENCRFCANNKTEIIHCNMSATYRQWVSSYSARHMD